MSDYRALAAVTQGLVDLINNALCHHDPSGAHAEPGPPENNPVRRSQGLVRVFLYQVSPNANWRNAELPIRRADGTVIQRPMAAVDLHYLLCFYGEGLMQELLAGSTISALHSHPILNSADFPSSSGNGGSRGQLDGSGVAEQAEIIRFRPQPFSHDELSRLWSVFFQVPYTLSMAYLCSVILIEPEDIVPQPALPSRRSIHSLGAVQPPTIERVEPPVIDFAAGEKVVLRGRNLSQPGLAAWIGGDPAKVTSATPAQLTLELPAGLEAGAQTIQLRAPGGDSEPTSVVVRPVLESIALAADGSKIEVKAQPAPGANQRVELLLNEKPPAEGETPRSYQLRGVVGEGSVLEFPLPPHESAATYLTRLQVGGVASALDYDEQGGYTGPLLEVPAR